MNKLFVLDTNNLVSAFLIEGTITAQAMDKAVVLGQLVFSDATMNEFVEVLFRKNSTNIL